VPAVAPGVIKVVHDEQAEPHQQTLDNTFVGFFRLDELSFPYPCVLAIHPEKQPRAQLAVVARSAASSTVAPGPTLDLRVRSDWAPRGPTRQRPIAVTVTGELTSAFASKPIEGIELTKASAPGSRVAVVAASQFLANPFARAGNPPAEALPTDPLAPPGGDATLRSLATRYAQMNLTTTILAFKNLLDWAVSDASLVSCSALLLVPAPRL
jgi:hypothetical protein